jgi:bifunctional UDP-N-acetylglucosamine pyrophosphorylase/glucosamine-1-phosphate N-acetyltransferase
MKNNDKKIDPIAVVLLAAGLGKRMRSDLPKVLIAADGRAMVEYVIDEALTLNPERLVIVTGHKRELVESLLMKNYPDQCASKNLRFAFQAEQKGTGDAVRSALPELEGFVGPVVIVYGDTPLITGETLKGLLETHRNDHATVSLISVETRDPARYGRIIRAENGQVSTIREFKDCSATERLIHEINSGVYVVDSSFLPGALSKLENNNAQGEFYLTDIVGQAASEGQRVSCLQHFNLSELQGINNRIDLVEASRLLRERRILALIEAGVDIQNPATVEVARTAQIAAGVSIGAHTQILGDTIIGTGCVIEGFSVLVDCKIAERTVIHQFVHASKATIGADSQIGPFARLREGTVLAGENRIGNFVETKKASFDKGVKANHLSYLGDCSVGEASNIGAGTITCNYDGYKKSTTTIGKNVSIGSNSSLVAPVSIGDGATVGAGSVITKNVESDALGVTRAEQKTVPGWSKNKRAKNSSS